MDSIKIKPTDAEQIIKQSCNIDTVRRTLLNYESSSLMERAWRSANGRETYYSVNGLAEFCASWQLLHGASMKDLPGFTENDKLRLPAKFVAYVREYVLNKERVANFDYFSGDEEPSDLSIDVNALNYKLIEGFAHCWQWYRSIAFTVIENSFKK